MEGWRHRRLAEADAGFDKGRQQAVRALPDMEAAAGQDAVRLPEVADGVAGVGEAEHAWVVLFGRRAVPLEKRKAFGGGQADSFGELRGLVQRAEVRRVGLQGAQVEAVVT